MKVHELEHQIRLLLADSAGKACARPLDPSFVQLDFPRNENFGDLATTFVLRLAKEMKTAPRDLAEKIVAEVRTEKGGARSSIAELSVDGPGYINIRLSPAALTGVLGEILASDRFGAGEKKPGKILLEFVSANPTGPLTVAHGRQAALGDSLARILRYTGRDVDTEYYNNDEGVQINTLGRSLRVRTHQLRGEKIELAEDSYRGEYLVDIAKELAKRVDAKKLSVPAGEKESLAFFSKFARDRIMETIAKDLADFGVAFGSFYSQEALGKSGQVEKTLEELRKKGVIFEEEGAVWFRSTSFGDDKDRVLVKSDKTPTYLTPDIAYHRGKFARGYTELINIWGPDHHGYIARLKASQEALGHDPKRIEIRIAQLVTLYKGKEQVRMSTRAGEFVTLREILDEVGKDAGRFFFCMRKFESHLDFDLELAKKQAPDNPVFYVQYAHARISSIRKAQETAKVVWKPETADLGLLQAAEEVRVIRLLRQFPRAVQAAGAQLEPCVLVEYLQGLAAAFHPFYQQCRVITDDAALTQARLTLVFALQQVIRTGLELLGVGAPDQM